MGLIFVRKYSGVEFVTQIAESRIPMFWSWMMTILVYWDCIINPVKNEYYDQNFHMHHIWNIR